MALVSGLIPLEISMNGRLQLRYIYSLETVRFADIMFDVDI